MSISLGGKSGKGISINIGKDSSKSKGRSHLRGGSNHKTYGPKYYDEEKVASHGNTITLPPITLGRGGITIGDDGYQPSNLNSHQSYANNNYNNRYNNYNNRYNNYNNRYNNYNNRYNYDYYSYKPKPIFRLTLPEFSKTYIEKNLKLPPIKVKLNSSPRVKITTGTKDPLGKDPLEDPEIVDIFEPPLPFPKLGNKSDEDSLMMMNNQTNGLNGTTPSQPGSYPSYQPIYNGQPFYTGHPQPAPPSSLEYLSPPPNYNVQPSPNFVPLRGSNVIAPSVVYNQDIGNVRMANNQLVNSERFNYNYQSSHDNVAQQPQGNQNYYPNYSYNQKHDSSLNDNNNYKTAASGTHSYYSQPTTSNSKMISTPGNNAIHYTQNVNNSEVNKFHYSTGQEVHVFQQKKITNDQSYHVGALGQHVYGPLNEQNQHSNGQVHYQNEQGQFIIGKGQLINEPNQPNYGQILYAYGPKHPANTQGQLEPGEIKYEAGSTQNGHVPIQNEYGQVQNGNGQKKNFNQNFSKKSILDFRLPMACCSHLVSC